MGKTKYVRETVPVAKTKLKKVQAFETKIVKRPVKYYETKTIMVPQKVRTVACATKYQKIPYLKEQSKNCQYSQRSRLTTTDSSEMINNYNFAPSCTGKSVHSLN